MEVHSSHILLEPGGLRYGVRVSALICHTAPMSKDPRNRRQILKESTKVVPACTAVAALETFFRSCAYIPIR